MSDRVDRSDLAFLTIAEAGNLIRARQVSPVESVQDLLSRIARLDGPDGLNSYLTIAGEEALAQARRAEQDLASGMDRGALHGIPVALKDLFDTAGVRTTAGSKILAARVPDVDATVVRWLRDAGAIVLGKTHLHEFAFGTTNDNAHYGPCRNPWDMTRVPGGSSGGSGAALAAGLCLGALGTDTGGSIRIPAAACGIVGLKPTYGRVSRAGVIPLSWSLDHAGPMARTVEDTAILLAAIAGHDPNDPASAGEPLDDYRGALIGHSGARGLRIGVPAEHLWNDLNPEVEQAVRRAIGRLGELGAVIDEVSLPDLDLAPAAVSILMPSEAASYHLPWLRERPEDYGGSVRDRLELGLAITAVQYLEAQRARAFLIGQALRVMDEWDLLVGPTLPNVAPKIEAIRSPSPQARPADGPAPGVAGVPTRLTNPFNLLGFPAISVPCGFDGAGLPVGLQLVGRPWEEATVLRAAHAYEQATDWHRRHPVL
jgi:aspartyl-tRNA(Asn)/glutamyl-tRNA(Gln) amidotransferase subunit A